jgi:hypothetical protein
MQTPAPLSRRPLDVVWIAFFALNLGFITYIVDLEQLVIADPARFTYPLWPPPPLVDLVHWWGHHFDPVLLARPAWWRATIWIDALFFGPFYAVALYAFARGRDWIRIPTIVWASVMMTNVTIVLFEEMIGSHPTPARGMVLLANAPWLLVPLALLARMAVNDAPFAERRPATEREPARPQATAARSRTAGG